MKEDEAPIRLDYHGTRILDSDLGAKRFAAAGIRTPFGIIRWDWIALFCGACQLPWWLVSYFFFKGTPRARELDPFFVFRFCVPLAFTLPALAATIAATLRPRRRFIQILCGPVFVLSLLLVWLTLVTL